jgi:glutamate carboxypeptidase
MESARAGGKVVTARKGVGRFEVHVEGKPGHVGRLPRRGRSAIREAALQILWLEGLSNSARGITTTVGMISGGTAPNVIPQHCRFTVDLRVATPADGEEYVRMIQGMKPLDEEVKIEVVGTLTRPPYEKTEPIARLHAQAREIAAGLGMTLDDAEMSGGGSDANFPASLGIPTLDGLGVSGAGAHTLAEYLLVSSVMPRIRLVTRLLEAGHLG